MMGTQQIVAFTCIDLVTSMTMLVGHVTPPSNDANAEDIPSSHLHFVLDKLREDWLRTNPFPKCSSDFISWLVTEHGWVVLDYDVTVYSF